jgi:2-C-methyl-D-erythritol 4-phosphate cytidylyltransferase
MHTSVIIPAAGIGERMGSAIGKQFLSIKGTPIIVHTLRCFQQSAAIDEIVIVTREDSFALLEELLSQSGLTKVRPLVKGGARRQDSVANGLRAVSAGTEIVLVHDAVRPFILQSTITQVTDAARHFGAAIAAVRAKDTIKQAGTDGRVALTLDRSFLWNVQTPQAFRLDILRRAYELAERDGRSATDDSSLVEALGIAPVIVEASYDNIKITTPDDLLLGELLAERYTSA